MRLLRWIVALIPHAWFDACGAALGALLWGLRIRRRVVLENLRLAFPEKTEAQRLDLARRAYRNLGRIVPDFLRLPFLTREQVERMFEYEDWDRLTGALALGKGVIACTAHFGHFDLLAAAHALRGVPVTMLSRPMGRSRANDVWRAIRRGAGVEDVVVSRGGDALRAILRALKAGRVIGYVIDQNQQRQHAIFPTFFGVPAATAATPAILSLRTGAPVVFAMSLPLPHGRHKVVIEGPIEPKITGDRDRDVLAFMQDLNDRLERWVRLHPEHWYWVHRRWKTRPAEEAAAAPRVTG